MHDLLPSLRAACDEQRYCTVHREFGDASRLSGYVLEVNEAVVAMEVFHDFYSEGTVLVAAASARRVEMEARDDLFHRVISGEQLRTSHRVPAEHLRSFGALLEWSLLGKHLIIVECETHIGHDGDFHVGRVEGIDERSIAIHGIDPQGVWHDDETEVELARITLLGALTPYLRYFEKYASDES